MACTAARPCQWQETTHRLTILLDECLHLLGRATVAKIADGKHGLNLDIVLAMQKLVDDTNMHTGTENLLDLRARSRRDVGQGPACQAAYFLDRMRQQGRQSGQRAALEKHIRHLVGAGQQVGHAANGLLLDLQVVVHEQLDEGGSASALDGRADTRFIATDGEVLDDPTGVGDGFHVRASRQQLGNRCVRMSVCACVRVFPTEPVTTTASVSIGMGSGPPRQMFQMHQIVVRSRCNSVVDTMMLASSGTMPECKILLRCLGSSPAMLASA